MIIIKTNGDRTDEITMAISTILFNMELGKKVFNAKAEIDSPDEDYHTISNRGITYAIQGIIGNICILYRGNDRRYSEFLSWDIERNLRALDTIYIEKFGNIHSYAITSMDYTLVSEKPTDVYRDRRRLVHKHDAPSFRGCFTWRVVMNNQELLQKNHISPSRSRNIWEYDNLVWHNTLVIDVEDIFINIDRPIFTSVEPAISEYNMSKNMVSLYTVPYSRKYGGIDTILRDMNFPHMSYNKEINADMLCIPIYEEEWKNIAPMRVMYDEPATRPMYIWNLLHSEYNHTLMDLEEVKNVESGAPPRPNDVCHSCEMYLYDMIYVLELKENHVCVCSRCFHNSIYIDMIQALECADITVLKVMYPKTVVDIINRTNMDNNFKALLIELSSGELDINEDVITTPNFIGYTNIYNVLMKIIIPPVNKKIFICKIVY